MSLPIQPSDRGRVVGPLADGPGPDSVAGRESTGAGTVPRPGEARERRARFRHADLEGCHGEATLLTVEARPFDGVHWTTFPPTHEGFPGFADVFPCRKLAPFRECEPNDSTR